MWVDITFMACVYMFKYIGQTELKEASYGGRFKGRKENLTIRRPLCTILSSQTHVTMSFDVCGIYFQTSMIEWSLTKENMICQTYDMIKHIDVAWMRMSF